MIPDAQSNLFLTNKTLQIAGRLIDLSTPRIMGVLNVTPDSFYDGGRYSDEKSIVSQAEKMLDEGATFIDVGAYSSRPGASDVPAEEEGARAVQAIRWIKREFPDALVCIDTFRSAVAKAAVREGACMVNDISGGDLDPEMLNTVATLNVPYVVMHMRGTPQTMTSLTKYENLYTEILSYFAQKLDGLTRAGVADVILDPGFGFAKNIPQNFELLKHLDIFKCFGRPLLVGLSRKSMVWKTLGISPGEALNGTTALNAIAIAKGASILRVHDVKEAREVVKLMDQMNLPITQP
jgi:dihydropteroate synthase